MAEIERLVKFHLLGQDFAFYTGATEKEMEAILALVRKHVEDSSSVAGGTMQVGKIAVMACLNLASRYVRLEQEYKDYRNNSETNLKGLNEKIELHFPQGKIAES